MLHHQIERTLGDRSGVAKVPAASRRGRRGCSRWRGNEIEARPIQTIRAVERVLSERPDGHRLPVNIDGAIAALCGDIGIPPEIANALFIISRVPGIAAHAHEERQRESPMRQIDPKDHAYDGPLERRLPEKRR